MPPIQNGGAAIGGTNLYSTSGTSIDVYPFIVLAMDAFAQISLRGETAIKPTHLPTGQKDKADIFGQRGYVGAMWWKAVLRKNDGWMAIGNVGVKNLE
jgi:N4-gp56 family major capsid protein